MIEPASTGVLGTLGISLGQFLAQLLNFSIVLFVMWKWVYTPLLKTMDARSKEIADGLANAKAAEQRLMDAADEKERLLKEARVQAQSLLEEVKTKAEKVRQDKLAIAMNEIEQHITEAKTQIKSERDAAAVSLKREVAHLVVLATEKVASGMDESTRKALAAQAVEDVQDA